MMFLPTLFGKTTLFGRGIQFIFPTKIPFIAD